MGNYRFFFFFFFLVKKVRTDCNLIYGADAIDLVCTKEVKNNICHWEAFI